jgi:hypothetical protein
MPLSEKRILASVTINHKVGAVEVCWSDQILRDDQVISEQNHRKAYGAEQLAEFEAEVEGAESYSSILESLSAGS